MPLSRALRILDEIAAFIMNFDTIAPVYDFLVSITMGRTHRLAHQHLLSFIPKQAKILLVGGGSGKLLLELIHTCNPRYILYLESSERMLDLAKNRLRKLRMLNIDSRKVVFRLGDQTTLTDNECFQVLLTPFVLDIYPQADLEQLIRKLDQHVLYNGRWVHLDFYPSNQKLSFIKLFHWLMYRFFRVVSRIPATKIPDYDQAINALDYCKLEEKRYPFSVRCVVYDKTVCSSL